MTMKKLLELKKISKTYGNIQALRNIDMDLQEGEIQSGTILDTCTYNGVYHTLLDVGGAPDEAEGIYNFTGITVTNITLDVQIIWNGIITNVDGDYILVRPMWTNREIEFYPCELRKLK